MENIDYTQFSLWHLLITILEDTACLQKSPEVHSDSDRSSSCSQRAVNDWNALPQSVVDASSVNSFKNRLDKYWKDSFGFTSSSIYKYKYKYK